MKNKVSPLWKIKQLTTKIGIYQHGKLNLPDPQKGYALEDQARALIIAHAFKEKNLEKIYLNYIKKAQTPNGLLYHYFYEDKGGFCDKELSGEKKSSIQEAYGITLWALLKTKNFRKDPFKKIVNNLKNHARSWTSPRAIAAALLGMASLSYNDPLEEKFLEKLHLLFEKTAQEDWKWFENYLVYANAIIPWALWEENLKKERPNSLSIAEKSTIFLIETCQIKGIPAPIGNKNWFQKGQEKPLYDQQPIDAAYMVCLLEKAYQKTKNKFYLVWAKKWWKWFWGENIQKKSLIDKNFACFDALTENGVNLNQGAESNICFLMAYLAAKRLKIEK